MEHPAFLWLKKSSCHGDPIDPLYMYACGLESYISIWVNSCADRDVCRGVDVPTPRDMDERNFCLPKASVTILRIRVRCLQ